MPSRVLAHRQAPTSFAGPQQDERLEPGSWNDISERGQFLIDLEFLTRHTHPPPQKIKPTVIAEMACVYTQSPTYLLQIARQFPWVHFYAFQHLTNQSEQDVYDPAQPELVRDTTPTVQTELNRTTSSLEFSKENAIALSKVKEEKPERHRMVMICHGETPTRQLILHVLLRADFSMMDLCGPVPDEYIAGDLVFPICIPKRKMFMLLVADQECKAACYEPGTYKDEIGATSTSCFYTGKLTKAVSTVFFQDALRATEAYDQSSKDLIIDEYARWFWWYHQNDPEVIKTTLRGVVDTLHSGSNYYY